MNTFVFNGFSFWEKYNPWILLVVVLLAVVYMYMYMVKSRQYESKSSVISEPRQKISFMLGLLVYYLAEGSPLNLIANHFSFTVHMVQLSLELFVIPPLLLYGLPISLIRVIIREHYMGKIMSVVVHPVLCLIMFNVLVAVYHYPLWFNYMMSQDGSLFKMIYHFFLIVSAFQLWWVIVAPIPELDRLSGLKKMVYIIINGLLIYPVCVYIFFSTQVLYTSYAQMPSISTFMQPLDDQQVGGVVMKFIQEGAMICALAFIFSGWYRNEK